jgi:hypothetical protein
MAVCGLHYLRTESDGYQLTFTFFFRELITNAYIISSRQIQQTNRGLKTATPDHHAPQHTKKFFTNGAAEVPESPVGQDGSRNDGVLEVRSSWSFCLVTDNT